MSLRTINRMFIGGKWVCPTGRGTIDVISPTTEEAVVRLVDPSPADIDAAVAAARRAFDDSDWRWMTPLLRAERLEIVRKVLEQRWSDEIAQPSPCSRELQPRLRTHLTVVRWASSRVHND